MWAGHIVVRIWVASSPYGAQHKLVSYVRDGNIKTQYWYTINKFRYVGLFNQFRQNKLLYNTGIHFYYRM